jgi:hypothetical protein
MGNIVLEEPGAFIFRTKETFSNLKMEVSGFSEMLIRAYKTTGRHFPENRNVSTSVTN